MTSAKNQWSGTHVVAARCCDTMGGAQVVPQVVLQVVAQKDPHLKVTKWCHMEIQRDV